MQRRPQAVIGLCFAFVVSAARAQEPPADPTPPALDEIRAAVAEVSEKELAANLAALVSFGTRHTMSETRSTTRGIGAARRFLKDRLDAYAAAAGGAMKVEFQSYLHLPDGRRIDRETEIVNVLATVPGTDPDRLVIVSGHYDSMPKNVMDRDADAPGANDDGSGTVVALECARVLAGRKPRATLVFAAVAGEEQSLLGSAHLAKTIETAGKSVVFMVTNDIVGGVVGSNGRRDPQVLRCFSEGVVSGPKDERGRTLRTVEGSDHDAPSRQVARYLAARGPLYVPGFEVRLIFRQDRYLRGGDHRSFNDRGFAAVRLTEPNENYDFQHQDVREEGGRKFGDRLEHVDIAYVARVARVNLAAALEAALAPASPRQVRIDVRGLTPHSTLRWKANEEADLAGYAVLVRRTHEPTWTGRFVVEKGRTEIELKGYSKDDWLFAVEAFDAAGRRSPPVYPAPQMR
jgi:hypothetical protein